MARKKKTTTKRTWRRIKRTADIETKKTDGDVYAAGTKRKMAAEIETKTNPPADMTTEVEVELQKKMEMMKIRIEMEMREKEAYTLAKGTCTLSDDGRKIFSEALNHEKNYSPTAIAHFIERLSGSAEEMKTKLVYLCVKEPNGEMGWLLINPFHVEILQGCFPSNTTKFKLPREYVLPREYELPIMEVKLSRNTEVMVNPESGFPPELHSLTDFGCAVWDSTKILIVGGKRNKVASDRVYIYDLVSKTWDASLVTKVGRGEKPAVVAAGSKFYIFGGIGDGPGHGLPWAEGFEVDLESNHYEPFVLGGQDFLCDRKIIDHAVTGNQIMLFIHPCDLLCYDYSTERWDRSGVVTIAKGLTWSTSVVVFEDFLFWHHYGTIYLHDLLNHVTTPMCTMYRDRLSSACFSDVPPPRFLVHIGMGKLCLLYQVHKYICYVTFFVHVRWGVTGPRLPGIEIGNSGFFCSPMVGDILHAFEISS